MIQVLGAIAMVAMGIVAWLIIGSLLYGLLLRWWPDDDNDLSVSDFEGKLLVGMIVVLWPIAAVIAAIAWAYRGMRFLLIGAYRLGAGR